MPNQILTLKDTFVAGMTAGFTSFMQFIPALFGAAIVLAIGWIIAGMISKVLERVLLSLRFEAAATRIGVSAPLQRAFGTEFTMTHGLSLMTKWFVRLIFVQAAANILAMPQVTAIINSIVLFIPNLFVALVIIVVGALSAEAVGRLVAASVTRTGVSNPKLFSLIARYAVLGFTAIAAVNQLGIATNLLNVLFTGLVGSITLALGLAFGLGGQGVAQDMTRSWYEESKGASTRLKQINPPTPRIQSK